jgi:nitrite reductase (NO-forming)
MDLKTHAAKLSSERHQGAFAEGSALSLGADLKPLDPHRSKRCGSTRAQNRRDRPGVKFSAWTFGNQVPGPTVRARVGDKIKFA